ncbi:MAG: hypothetical protein K8I00_10170 [Candidatus Omnitrophica bacterium]|nr:hypothetical protein [Candidatus Omnitrophota bacterium]
MPRHGLYLTLLAFLLTGCVTSGTSLRVPDFAQRREPLRTVAVMPLRLNLFQVQAGGNAELIDEWRDEATGLMTAALDEHLGKGQGLNLTFAEKDYLNQYHAVLWRKYRGLFETVAGAATVHGFDGTAFPAKVANFDYTLGPGAAELAAVFDADALLFVYGTDYTTTMGRKWVAAANLGLVEAGFDGLLMALVDGRSGDLLWLKRSQPYENQNLRDAREVDRIITWMCLDISGETR